MEMPSAEDGLKRNPNKVDAVVRTDFASIPVLAFISVTLPLSGLLISFTSSYILQFDDVRESSCKVFNVIPSISAVTGVTPQTYLWRMCISLHTGPRILFSYLYRNYFLNIRNIRMNSGDDYNKFPIYIFFWLNIFELLAFCGLTFVSNREYYPVHEKCFISFMIFSHLYMLMLIYSYRTFRSYIPNFHKLSYAIKKTLFSISIAATVTMIFFYMQHKLFCTDLAFSWFSLCEYIIACCNMGFHWTVALDFQDKRVVVTSLT